ncbi:MAG: KR domain-containing protein, partial [Acidobacteriota bacterium]|nr:KR domain-containing protein [Acidobacteriota bacterium]
EREEAPASIDRAARDTTLAFLSPMFLEQAFIRHNLLDDLAIIVAASHVFDVGAEPVRNPTKALALGPCRVIGKELPMVRARFVDAAPPADARGARALATALVAEARLRSQETVVAYRGPHRFTQTFEAAPLPPADIRPRLRDGGVYLVTGGLGGLGLFIAQQIALTVKAPTFVLTHRSGVPDRAAWPQWLQEHPAEEETSSRIQGILAIEDAGGTVVLARAASEDLAAMQAVVEDTERRFGRINGVLHFAGMPGEGIISLKTEQMVREVLAPKIVGTLVLDQLFRGRGADFIVLLSSITTVLGEAGRVDYCSANAFMDAMAHYRRDDPDSPFVAMNFGAWAGFGMAARWEERKAARAAARRKAQTAPGGQRLQFVSRDGAQEIYDVLLDPSRDWVISTHLVFGIPTVVGTTFLDLVAEFIETRHPGSTCALRNMAFISPLMFEAGVDKRIRLLVREGDGGYRFSVRSQVAARGTRDVWHEHFKGEVSADAPADVPRVDMAALLHRFDGAIDHSSFIISDDSGSAVLDLGERWDNRRELRTSNGEWLARIELGTAFAADLADYAFHPAIMDVAMASAVRFVAESMYLPSGYSRMALRHRLPARVWSHIRPNGDIAPGADVIGFDITILDDDGRELASIERFTLAKVTARAAAPGSPGARVKATMPATAAGSKDLQPAEGWDAFTRILAGPSLPQVIVSTSDLYALIEDEEPVTASAKAAGGDTASAKAGGYSRPSLSTPYEEPANEIEKAIAEVWAGILGIEQIGVHDDFTELGGNSLLAVQAVANTADAFQVDLPVDAFYRKPTIRGLGETVVELLVGMAGEETLEDLITSLET